MGTRLDHESVGSRVHGSRVRFMIGVSGDENNRHQHARLQPLDSLNSVERARELDVHEHQVYGRPIFYKVKYRFTVVENASNVVIVLFETRPYVFSYYELVFQDKYGRFFHFLVMRKLY